MKQEVSSIERVVGYVRVSTEDQGEFGSSPDAQAARIRAYCEAAKLDLVDLVDVDESAKSLDRPGLKAVLARLDAGDAQGVVVAKIDRLTRDVGDLEELLRHYFGTAPGKRLYSVAEAVDTSSAKGRFMLRLHVILAQLERETTVERTQEVLDFKRLQGDRTGGLPYGWDLDPTGPVNKRGRPVRLVRNEEEQATIAWIIAMKAEGVGLRTIAEQLEHARVPTKQGRGSWSHSAVAKILARAERATS